MRSMRQRVVRLTGALLMVALLIVPVAASAHTHRGLRATGSCATCVAAHHSPAVVMPAVAAAASLAVTVAPPLPSRVAPAHPYRSPRAVGPRRLPLPFQSTDSPGSARAPPRPVPGAVASGM